MTMSLEPFHLAIPVDDIDAARAFYGNVLGCAEGRSAPTWVDFNLFGHQLVVHLHARVRTGDREHSSEVDGHDVPVPHFGVVLDWTRWEALASRLTAHGVKFGIEPHVRFKGQVGEQATMFFRDPAGNALEFKAFKDKARLFAK
jgi:extradiol dioxygenase family protein